MSEIVVHPKVARDIKEDRCPVCSGELDTGFECLDCGFDALPLLSPQDEKQ
jgi:hypothetical protein